MSQITLIEKGLINLGLDQITIIGEESAIDVEINDRIILDILKVLKPPYSKKIFYFDIKPVPKPRRVYSDRYTKRDPVLKYQLFADQFQKLAIQAKYKLSSILSITFLLKLPESWTKKQKHRMNLKHHEQRPD